MTERRTQPPVKGAAQDAVGAAGGCSRGPKAQAALLGGRLQLGPQLGSLGRV